LVYTLTANLLDENKYHKEKKFKKWWLSYKVQKKLIFVIHISVINVQRIGRHCGIVVTIQKLLPHSLDDCHISICKVNWMFSRRNLRK
jgi:hypothetical protein